MLDWLLRKLPGEHESPFDRDRDPRGRMLSQDHRGADSHDVIDKDGVVGGTPQDGSPDES